MIHLDLYDVLAVAARVLGCDSAGVVDRVDLHELGQALTRPGDGGDLADAAAGLLGGLLRCRPFRGPNRRISVAVTLQFLAVNNYDLRLEPTQELTDLLDRAAQQDKRVAADPALADEIRARLVPGREHRQAGTDPTSVSHGEEIQMFERFSERARRVTVAAPEEARALNHAYVGTEHLLLGLIRERDGIAVKALANLGISRSVVRGMVERIVGQGSDEPGGHIPFSPRAKVVLELSQREALQLGQNYVGTEHILLGLIREGEGVAALALGRLGADLPKVRQQVVELLDRRLREEEAPASTVEDTAAELLAYAVQNFSPGSSTEAEQSARRRRLVVELTDLLDENDRLHAEVVRLRRRLRDNDLDPDA